FSGCLCLWASRGKTPRSKERTFMLTSLGAILIVLGVTGVYITKVADDVSFWVWFAAALIFIFLVRFGFTALQDSIWRFPAYGSMAVFAGSLLGGLVELEDFAGLVVTAAVLILWALAALEAPSTMPEKVSRWTVCIAALVFNIALYALS